MKNLKSLTTVAMMLLLLVLFGCATQTALPKTNELSSFKGMTSQEVLNRLGEPDKKHISNSQEIWQYRRPDPTRQGANVFAAISTFGMVTGSDSLHANLLLITITENVVTGYHYVGEDGSTIAEKSKPEEVKTAPVLEPTPEKTMATTPTPVVKKKKTTKK